MQLMSNKKEIFFREFEPASELQPWIQSIWTLQSKNHLTESVLTRVVSSGTVDLMVNLGGPVKVIGAGEKINQNSTCVIGPIHAPFLLSFSTKVEIMGVRFRYGGAAPLLNVCPKSSGIRRIDGLNFNVLAKGGGSRQRILGMEIKLLERINAKHRPDIEFQELISNIEDEPGDFRVYDMRRFLGVSERQLQRYTLKHYWVTPSTLLRLIRFRQCLRNLRHLSLESWIELAQCCGYYDQAHFIKNFRFFTGITPTVFLREDIRKNNMVNFYIRKENYQRYPNLTSHIG
jgi:AraC-like DNA-binding protein